MPSASSVSSRTPGVTTSWPSSSSLSWESGTATDRGATTIALGTMTGLDETPARILLRAVVTSLDVKPDAAAGVSAGFATTTAAGTFTATGEATSGSRTGRSVTTVGMASTRGVAVPAARANAASPVRRRPVVAAAMLTIDFTVVHHLSLGPVSHCLLFPFSAHTIPGAWISRLVDHCWSRDISRTCVSTCRWDGS